MQSRGAMVCCFSHGVLTRAEREAIAKLRERRELGHVPGTTTHVATADRMDPLVSFYSSGNLVAPPSRTKLPLQSNPRPSGPSTRNNVYARQTKQHHGNIRPSQPNSNVNRSDPRHQTQGGHNLQRHPQTHPQPNGSGGLSRAHVLRSEKAGITHPYVRPAPAANSSSTGNGKALAAGPSTDARTNEAARRPQARTQHREMQRRPGAGFPQSRPRPAVDRSKGEPNTQAHLHQGLGDTQSSSVQAAGKPRRTPTNGISTTTEISAPRVPPPQSMPIKKAQTAPCPSAPPPPPLRTQHAQEVGEAGGIVKMSSHPGKHPQKPTKLAQKAKSFGDGEVKIKDNSLRSNAHARTDLRPLHVPEIAPPRVRVNVRAANGADGRRHRRGGRAVGPGSAFAAVSAALGRRRGALQPSAAIVDTSIADAVAMPSGVRARERVAELRERDSPRSGRDTVRTRDVTPVTQGVTTMLKALTLLHVSRTAGMTGSSAGKTRLPATRETDTDDDTDFEADKEKENSRVNERKVGRIAWASKKKFEDVMSKLAGQSAKGERFVMKARPQLSDLADANNDVYFQKLMNDGR